MQIQAANAPLGVRNLAPAAHLFGLPRMLGSQVLTDAASVSLNLELANNFTSDTTAETDAFFDGETSLYSFAYRAGIGKRSEWGFEVPYVKHSGGILDGTIEGFHDVLGFKDGSRPIAGRNKIDYFIRHEGVNYVDFQSNQSDLGDVRLWAGRSLYATNGRALTARALVKAPTGKVNNLSGSEAWDVSLWVEYSDEAWLADYDLAITAGFGVGYLGEGELAPDAQRNSVAFAHIGLNYALSDGLSLFAQIDSHSELIATGVSELSAAAVQGTLGARLNFNQNKMWIDFGFMEDIRHQSSPDVVFQLLFGATL